MKSLKSLGSEEVFNITPGKRSLAKSREPEKKFDFSGASWRAFPFYLALFISFSFLWISAFFLQVVDGEKNLQLSANNSIRSTKIRAERGAILDRSKKIIARNRPGFSVELNTKECQDLVSCKKIIAEVSKLIDFDIQKATAQLEKGLGQVTLVSGLKRDDVIKVESRLADFPGLSTQVDPVREYIDGTAFAHVLGYIGEGKEAEREGKSGLEKYYDFYLKGELGSKIIQVDSLGSNPVQVARKNPVAGKNLILNIDKELQEVSYKALRDSVERLDKDGKPLTGARANGPKPKGGAVVALDPSTGGVLALVSYPSFDPNLFASGISSEDYKKLIENPNNPFFNRVISAVYPPGSTYKMATSLVGLREKVIKPNSLVDCPSSISVGSFTFRDWYSGGRGPIDLERALQISCDTYYYSIAGGYGNQRGFGIQPLADFSRKLGFGSKTDIDLEGEASGVFPDPDWKQQNKGEGWYLGDTYITSIGQGNILATPLQLTNYVSFFANRGKIYKPQVVKEIVGVREFKPQLVFEDNSDFEYIEAILKGMKASVVSGGTAWPLFDFTDKHPGIELAGKTGTAEFGNPVEDGSLKTHAWFTVFGPYQEPNIVLTVLLEEGGGGSGDAAPVARKILDHWFKDSAKNE